MKIEWQRAAAYIVAIDQENKILLTQFEREGHPRSGAWTLPGGGMEWGEQPNETALRELREETGLTAQIERLLGVQSEWFSGEKSGFGQVGHAIRVVFKAGNCVGRLKDDFSEDDTTAAAAWFEISELENLDRVSVVDFGVGLAL